MLKVHFRRTMILAVLGALLGWFVSFRSDKIYESSVELMAGSPTLTADTTMPLEIRRLLLPGVINDVESDIGLIRSQRMFQDGLTRAARERNNDQLASPITFQELFPMYDVDVPQSVNQYTPDQQRVVRMRVRAKSPDDSAAIANNVALSFAEYRKQRARTAVKDALDVVEGSAKRAKQELDRIQKDMRELKMGDKIVDIDRSGAALTDALEGQRVKRETLLAELAGSRAEYSSLKFELGKIPKMIPGATLTIADPSLDGYRNLVIQAESQLNELRTQYLDDSIYVKQAADKLKSAQARLARAEKEAKDVKNSSQTSVNAGWIDLQNRVAAAKARIDSLQSQLEPINASILTYETRATTMPGVETKYMELQRNRLVYEEQFQKNQRWVEELQTARDGATSQIQNLANPEIAIQVAPDSKKYIILAAVLGALIGLAYSFAIESFRLPVHTSWQLAELTSLPVAASVPMLPKPLARRHMASINRPEFRPIESFRYMAFSLISRDDRPRVILFSAVGEDVDSTAAAAEFAIAMSKTGSKTALVDCDLRRPRLSELFGVQARSGVAEILGRSILPGEAVDLFVNTEHDNLIILPAGSASASGLSDFVTSHMSGLIEDLREKADTVVINVPPVDVFADTSRLAQYVDQTCLVVSAKTTSYRAIPIAQEILSKSGAKDVSIILINASPTEEPFGLRSEATVAGR